MKLGYLLNFGQDMMKIGITRTVIVPARTNKNLAILAALREKQKLESGPRR